VKANGKESQLKREKDSERQGNWAEPLGGKREERVAKFWEKRK